MTWMEGSNQLTGEVNIYIAPLQALVPETAVDPASDPDWTLLCTTDGRQQTLYSGRNVYFFDNNHEGPVMCSLPKQEVILQFYAVRLTKEMFYQILSSLENMETDTETNNDIVIMPLKRLRRPKEYSALFRGRVLSKYGTFSGMYVIPRGVFDGEPTIDVSEDGTETLFIEFHALEDDDQEEMRRLGWIALQTS